MNIPMHSAELAVNFYSPVVSWESPYTYNRPTTLFKTAFPEHYTDEDPVPALSITQGMVPRMRPFPEGTLYSAVPNEGLAENGYNATLYAEPSLYYFSGEWSYARLLQQQIPLWEQSNTQQKAWLLAYENRQLEDTWITEARYWKEPDYIADLSQGIIHSEQAIGGSSIRIHHFEQTPTGKVRIRHELTPCLQRATVRAKQATYRLWSYYDSVIAFESSELPLMETVAIETCEPIRPSIINWFLNEAGSAIDYGLMRPILYTDISDTLPPQPRRWEQPFDIAAADAAIVAHYEGSVGGTIGAGHVDSVAITSVSETQWLSNIATGVDDDPSNTFLLANYPVGKTAIDAWQSLIEITQVTYTATYNLSYTGGNSGPAIHVTSGQGYSYATSRPKPWKFDDPEFIGYVPFQEELLANPGLMREYIRNPSAIFDGFYFQRKLKLATVTRAWFALVKNHSSDGPEDNFLRVAHRAQLNLYGFKDSDTGEIISSNLNYCPGMVSQETYTLTPGMVRPIERDEAFWGEYDWPDVSVTLPGGSFFLTDGSDAPIYPDFHGAYVYDLHLKKWGKYQGEYKRLIDYAAINTFLPGEQSYSRFGIFGGVLQEDGTIRLFDARPSDSKIVYGKIGYYRQGMTSPEEVRVHMRTPSTGTLELESSVEGKLITAGFGQSWDFVSEVSWIGYGGYSAKWHNIVIKGQYDISYLEFRGITSGRR